MFDFDNEDDREARHARADRIRQVIKDARLKTSEGRFHYRIEQWQEKKGSALGHHFWWFVHNCISHPLIGVLPRNETFRFHDFTSDKINCK